MKRLIKKIIKAVRRKAKPKARKAAYVEPEVVEPRVWTTAQGEALTMSEIENDHLVNILKFLAKRKNYQDMSAEIHADCKYGDDDATRIALRMRLQSVEERFPIFTIMKKEAIRRELI